MDLLAIDLSPGMLERAKRREREAQCRVTLFQEDVCTMESLSSEAFDWIVATFLCCALQETGFRNYMVVIVTPTI